jgi:hypothetical protein
VLSFFTGGIDDSPTSTTHSPAANPSSRHFGRYCHLLLSATGQFPSVHILRYLLFVAIGRSVFFIFIVGNSIGAGMAEGNGKLYTRQGLDLKREFECQESFMAEAKAKACQWQRRKCTLG